MSSIRRLVADDKPAPGPGSARERREPTFTTSARADARPAGFRKPSDEAAGGAETLDGSTPSARAERFRHASTTDHARRPLDLSPLAVTPDTPSADSDAAEGAGDTPPAADDATDRATDRAAARDALVLTPDFRVSPRPEDAPSAKAAREADPSTDPLADLGPLRVEPSTKPAREGDASYFQMDGTIPFSDPELIPLPKFLTSRRAAVADREGRSTLDWQDDAAKPAASTPSWFHVPEAAIEEARREEERDHREGMEEAAAAARPAPGAADMDKADFDMANLDLADRDSAGAEPAARGKARQSDDGRDAPYIDRTAAEAEAAPFRETGQTTPHASFYEDEHYEPPFKDMVSGDDLLLAAMERALEEGDSEERAHAARGDTVDPDLDNPTEEADVAEDVDDQDRFAVLEDTVLDEDGLRELVATLVREELQGVLGERITRNVRKLVRREIHRVLASRDFE
ncbi:hypothetical protein [Brevirhabdus sp.]|uniref:hypothetical protein n=1 Tax=Brevirhabdus sp. TaxID=2004514 RepID=UPI0040598EA6